MMMGLENVRDGDDRVMMMMVLMAVDDTFTMGVLMTWSCWKN